MSCSFDCELKLKHGNKTEVIKSANATSIDGYEWSYLHYNKVIIPRLKYKVRYSYTCFAKDDHEELTGANFTG